MNRKKIATITAASLAAVIIIYYLTTDYLNNDSDIAVVVDSNSSTIETGQNEKVGSEPLSINQVISKKDVAQASFTTNVISEFEAAVNAEDAMAIIDQAYDMGESTLAQRLEVELHQRCGLIDDDFEPPFGETKWAFDNLTDYCSTYQPSMSPEEFERRSSKIATSTSVAASSLFQKYLEMDHADVESDFTDLIASASSTEDFWIGRNVIKLMHNSGTPLSIGQDEYQYSSPAQAKTVKLAALQLYSCYRLGGCDSNSHQMRDLCVFSPQCDPSWSLVDFYANTLSPIDFDHVTSIFWYLHDHQVGG